MNHSTAEFLVNVACFSAWVPLLAWGYVRWKMRRKSLNVSPLLLNWVALYFLLVVMVGAGVFLFRRLSINNSILIYLYMLAQYPVALVIYRYSLSELPVRLFWWLGVSFLVFKIIHWSLWYPSLEPTQLFAGIVFTGLGTYYLYRLPKITTPAEYTFAFWICLAFSIYYTGNMLNFVTLDEIIAGRAPATNLGIFAILNITQALIVALGLLLIQPNMRVS